MAVYDIIQKVSLSRFISITFFSLLVLVLGGIFLIKPSSAQTKAPEPAKFADDRVVIKFKASTEDSEKSKVRQIVSASLEKKLDKLDAEVIKIPKGQVSNVLNALKNDGRVEYIEPDFIATTAMVPNDTYYSLQWAYPDISAPSAWDISTGSTSTVIGMVDTGIDQFHPDLASKIIGRANFTTDPDLDNNGHGSHTAGIAGAITNNGIGVAGTCIQCNLLSVKVLDSSGSGYYDWIANGITWATDNGAKVISMSLGGTADSTILSDAVNYAVSKGVVVVAAAGNSNSSSPFYPAYYSNVVAVAATDQSDAKASFSNYGSWVDIAAPGVNIASTYSTTIPGSSGYAYMSGTSMATPFVSGLAGLVFSQHPDWSNSQVISDIESTADPISGTGTYWMNGRIDTCRALGGCSVSPSPTPTATPTPTPGPSPVLVEAESMTLPSGTQIFSDSNASGGQAVVFFTNGTANENVTLNSPVTKITVRAEADYCRGNPRMNVKLDGSTIFNSLISPTSWADFNISRSVPAGNHTLNITYNNDFSNRNCDRNLRVDKTTFTP